MRLPVTGLFLIAMISGIPSVFVACSGGTGTGGVDADSWDDFGTDIPAVDADLESVDADLDVSDVPVIRRCNGYAELCDRRLDQVAFVTTHNSMANAEDLFAAPNHRTSVAGQLAAGVRAFMLDTHYLYENSPQDGDEVLLCHGTCALGQRPLKDTLTDMRTFLEQNPGEIIVIIFESYVSATHTENSFEASGTLQYLLDPQPDAPLPTLGEMVDSGRRMVVLTDFDGGGFPGYLPVWDWAWDNDWDNKVPTDLNCDVNRGSDTNPLFILNHFLTDPFASEELAGQVNFNPFFIDQAERCRQERGHVPNFVTVDFFEIGDVSAVVMALNGVG